MHILDQSLLETADNTARLASPVYQHNIYRARDWTPPPILRTPLDRPPAIPRNDLKPQLDISAADLARFPLRRIAPPTPQPPVQTTPAGKGRGFLDFSTPVANPKTPWRKTTPGQPERPKATSTPGKLLAWLEAQPKTKAYTSSEMAAALGIETHRLRCHLYHAPTTMPWLEWRIISMAIGGREAQYRLLGKHKWPPLPPGIKVSRYSHDRTQPGSVNPLNGRDANDSDWYSARHPHRW